MNSVWFSELLVEMEKNKSVKHMIDRTVEFIESDIDKKYFNIKLHLSDDLTKLKNLNIKYIDISYLLILEVPYIDKEKQNLPHLVGIFGHFSRSVYHQKHNGEMIDYFSMNFLRGILNFSFGNFYLIPKEYFRNLKELQGGFAPLKQIREITEKNPNLHKLAFSTYVYKNKFRDTIDSEPYGNVTDLTIHYYNLNTFIHLDPGFLKNIKKLTITIDKASQEIIDILSITNLTDLRIVAEGSDNLSFVGFPSLKNLVLESAGIFISGWNIQEFKIFALETFKGVFNNIFPMIFWDCYRIDTLDIELINPIVNQQIFSIPLSLKKFTMNKANIDIPKIDFFCNTKLLFNCSTKTFTLN